MTRLLQILAVVLASLVLLVGVSMFSLYEASQQVPDFYRVAIARDEAEQTKASDELLHHAASLAGDVHRRGHWKAIFSAQQINGWLAVDLIQNHPNLLPPEIRDPRVDIREREATVACRYDSGELTAVFSLTFNVYLSAPNVVAVRIRKARAGMLPIPLTIVLDGISQAIRTLDLPLEWRQTDGDPVALITIAPPRNDSERGVELKTVELLDGELFLAGVTNGASKPPGAEQPAADQTTEAPPKDQSDGVPRVASETDEKENVQR